MASNDGEYIRIELVNGTNTYITIVPLPSRHPLDVAKTANEAAAWFSHSYTREQLSEEAVGAVKSLGR